jgi:hypothetical protein
MITVRQPRSCKICGYYLTTKAQYTGYRCVNPDHWQAAGLFAPRDFYSMARMAAGARAELARRPINRVALPAQIRSGAAIHEGSSLN